MSQELGAGPRTLTPPCHPRPVAATANEWVRVFLDRVDQRLQAVLDSLSTHMPLSAGNERGGWITGVILALAFSHCVCTGSCLTTARSETVGRTGDYFREFRVDKPFEGSHRLQN